MCAILICNFNSKLFTDIIFPQIIKSKKNYNCNIDENYFSIKPKKYQLQLYVCTKKENEIKYTKISKKKQIDMQKKLIINLSENINLKYYKGKPFYSNISDHGLISIRFAPILLKKKINKIDKELIPKLLNAWKLYRSNQIMKEVEGWKEQGNLITYRSAWRSNLYQCTWYVIQWNKYTQQLINEGYISCF